MARNEATMTAAATQAPAPAPASGELRDLVGTGTRDLDQLRGEVVELPFFQQVSTIMPGPDLAFGGTMLVVIMLVHAAGVRMLTNRVTQRHQRLLERPTAWRADVLMAGGVMFLLGLHVVEIVVWAGALVLSGLVADWRVAGLFAGSTYTTIGYDSILPRGWGMLAPLIAVSGLFAFGWSGSILVDLVGRCQRIKDRAAALRQEGTSRPPPSSPDAP